MTSLSFFFNKGGIGKTTLTGTMAWAFAQLGFRVLMIDLDFQANLSQWFLDNELLQGLWLDHKHAKTIFGAIAAVRSQPEQRFIPHIELLDDKVGLIAGDSQLSLVDARVDPTLALTFHEIFLRAAQAFEADILLFDLAPGFTQLNQSILFNTDWLVSPLPNGIMAIQGIEQFGTIQTMLAQQWPHLSEQLHTPAHPTMQPAGYLVMQHVRSMPQRTDLAITLPKAYREVIVKEPMLQPVSIEQDPYFLGGVKNYRSIVPLAFEAHKPLFALKPADGATGGLLNASLQAYQQFMRLAQRLAERCGIEHPR